MDLGGCQTSKEDNSFAKRTLKGRGFSGLSMDAKTGISDSRFIK
jgi:hypothetical protein